MDCLKYVSYECFLVHVSPKQEKTMHSCSASSGKPDSNSLDCIVFFVTDVSATCFSLNLQILLSLPIMYNCIYILPFLGFKDTSFANFASTSQVFDNVRMLLIKILHLQFPKIHYRRYLFPYPLSCYLLHKLSRYITYKKIDIRNSSEYGVSVGDT